MATFQWQSIENCRSSIYQKGQTKKICYGYWPWT